MLCHIIQGLDHNLPCWESSCATRSFPAPNYSGHVLVFSWKHGVPGVWWAVPVVAAVVPGTTCCTVAGDCWGWDLSEQSGSVSVPAEMRCSGFPPTLSCGKPEQPSCPPTCHVVARFSIVSLEHRLEHGDREGWACWPG